MYVHALSVIFSFTIFTFAIATFLLCFVKHYPTGHTHTPNFIIAYPDALSIPVVCVQNVPGKRDISWITIAGPVSFLHGVHGLLACT